MSSDKQKAYNREYYLKHKDKLNARKKERYENDPEYRDGILRRSQARQDAVRAGMSKHLSFTVKHIDGQPFYSLSYVKAVINRSADWIREWEARGFIPHPTKKDGRGWRLYSQNQLEILSEAVVKYDSKEWTRDQLKEFLFANWENYQN